jgi:hypothetical protein
MSTVVASRVAGGVRHDERADALQAVVQAEPAGEHAVAEGHLGDVAGHDPGSRRQAGHELGPGVEVGPRVAADHRSTGGARRRVHLDYLLERHGEQAVRIGPAKVVFSGERQPGEIGQRSDVAGDHAELVEGGAVEGHVRRAQGGRAAQPVELQRREVGALHGLAWLVPDRHG